MADNYKYKNNKKANIAVIIVACIVLLTSIFVIARVIQQNGLGIQKSNNVYTINVAGKGYNNKIKNMTDGIFEYGTEAWERVHVLHDIVTERCEYKSSGYDNADDLLWHQNGNAYAYAELFKDLCNSCGIPCEIMTGFKDKFTNKTPWNWNCVEIDDKTYYVDVCSDDIEGGYSYFLLSYESFLAEGYDMRKPVNTENPEASYEVLRSRLNVTPIEFVEIR